MNMSSRQDLLHGELLAHLGDDVKNLGYLRQDGLALGTEGRWKPFSTSPPSKEACSLPETPADRDTNQKGQGVVSKSGVRAVHSRGISCQDVELFGEPLNSHDSRARDAPFNFQIPFDCLWVG
jgi:hypothetical protein